MGSPPSIQSACSRPTCRLCEAREGLDAAALLHHLRTLFHGHPYFLQGSNFILLQVPGPVIAEHTLQTRQAAGERSNGERGAIGVRCQHIGYIYSLMCVMRRGSAEALQEDLSLQITGIHESGRLSNQSIQTRGVTRGTARVAPGRQDACTGPASRHSLAYRNYEVVL